MRETQDQMRLFQGRQFSKSVLYLADLSILWTASAVTLVEALTAGDIASEPTHIVNKVLCSSELVNDGSTSPIKSESSISDELTTSSEHINKSTGPAELAISPPSARFLTHTSFPQVERADPPTPISLPESFEILIPTFPIPADTSRCKNRNCPIKSRHEQGPYHHKGKFHTREGSIFGSSNPPPETWFLYDMSSKESFQSNSGKAVAPVELFVKYHFGDTMGERILESNEAGVDVQERAKRGGRPWRFWS